MSYNLILNSTNNISVNNNRYQYNFINGSFKVPEGAEINIAQVTIPYSWYNVTSQLGNNTFQYFIANSSNVQTAYTVTLANGFYQLSDINNQLQATMRANGHYWYSTLLPNSSTQTQFQGSIAAGILTVNQTSSPSVQLFIGYVISYIPVGQTAYVNASVSAYGTSAGTYTVTGSTATTSTAMLAQTTSQITPSIIYPLTIATYTPQYTNSITSITVPTSANVVSVFGANYIQANGLNGTVSWVGGYPSIGTTCAYIQIPTTTSTTTTIGNLLGYTAGSYPSTNTGISATVFTQTVYGNSFLANPTFPPLGSTVNGVTILCNLVDNPISFPTSMLDSFPITSTFGSNINYLPIGNNNMTMKQGIYASMIIEFFDQNFNPLIMNDPNVLISIIITFPKKK